jgi:hypothetical protein
MISHGQCHSRKTQLDDESDPQQVEARLADARILEGMENKAQDVPEVARFARRPHLARYSSLHRWLLLAFLPTLWKKTEDAPQILESQAGRQFKTG